MIYIFLRNLNFDKNNSLKNFVICKKKSFLLLLFLQILKELTIKTSQYFFYFNPNDLKINKKKYYKEEIIFSS